VSLNNTVSRKVNTTLIIALPLTVIAVAAWSLWPRKKHTRVDASGVLFVRSLSRPLFLSWTEIESFGIASVCRIEEGLHQPGFRQYLGVRLTASSAQKESRVCRDNRRLSDYDHLFSPDSGMSVEAFAAYLECERSKFSKANKSLTQRRGADAPQRG
jgi:hypothetical protein